MIVPLYLPSLAHQDSDNITVLAADIGGTKTDIGLFRTKNQQLHLLHEATASSRDYTSFADVVLQFLQDHGAQTPNRLSIGVAGPVIGDRVQLTNLPWTLDKDLLRTATGIGEISLLNDLEATAYGLAGLDDEYLATIYPGKEGAQGNMAILAPGTGLGQAGLFWDGRFYHPFATEGGHCQFSPRDEMDLEIYQYLRKTNNTVSWEHLVSGRGIYAIYKFLRDIKGHHEPAWLRDKFAVDDPTAVISHTAMRELNDTCVQTMQLFVRFMACEAANLVLKLKATGGLYLGGGIPPRIYSLLRNEFFVSHFVQNDRMGYLLEEVPIKVILNSKTALLGAAHFGAFGTAR